MLGLNEPPAVSLPAPRRARAGAELRRVLRQRTASVPATYALLAANVAIFAAAAVVSESTRSFSPRDLISWGANFGPRTTNGEWWRLLTGTVLYAHLPHLIVNMIALLLVGRSWSASSAVARS
jgi:membrane associated rhomboid family serine protease